MDKKEQAYFNRIQKSLEAVQNVLEDMDGRKPGVKHGRTCLYCLREDIGKLRRVCEMTDEE